MTRKQVRQALHTQTSNVRLLCELQETRRHLSSVTSTLGLSVGLSPEDDALLKSVRLWLIRREQQTEDAVNNPPIMETPEG